MEQQFLWHCLQPRQWRAANWPGCVLPATYVLSLVLLTACGATARQPQQPPVFALIYGASATPIPTPTPSPAPSMEPSPSPTPMPAVAVISAPAAPAETVAVRLPSPRPATPSPSPQSSRAAPEGRVPSGGGCPGAYPVKLGRDGLVYSQRSPIYAQVTPIACFASVAAANGRPSP